MNEYKGYLITTAVPNFRTSAAMAHYRVDRRDLRDWELACTGTVHGNFDNRDDAYTAADAAARKWIDQYGT